jgi:uncharacterized protein (TIGR03118 family)
MFPSRFSGLCLALGVGLALTHLSAAAAPPFQAVSLVTDDQPSVLFAPGNPALGFKQIQDPGLINAWGISLSSTSPFWVSSNGAGTSTLYSVDLRTQAVAKASRTVTIPGAGNVTGQVFNGAPSQFNGDNFLFVSEDGNFSGWRSTLGNNAEPLSSLSAIYKGAAIASIGNDSYVYAADFHGGAINVFKGNLNAPILAGTFADPLLPSGYAPFNIQALAGSLYVAYAMQDPSSPDEVAGAGLGLIDRFDLQGRLVERIATGGSLNAPWGMAIAPSTFGNWSGALLVGNFGDGQISAFSAGSHAYLGQVSGRDGLPLVIDGLWALSPGNNRAAGSKDTIYFTAGPGDEAHGLFGYLLPVPEPGTAVILGAGLALVIWRAARRRSGWPSGGSV